MENTRLNASELEIELFQFLFDNGVDRFFSLISNVVSRSELTKKAVLVSSPNAFSMNLINAKLRETIYEESPELITGKFNVLTGENKSSVLKSLIDGGLGAKEIEDIIANSCLNPEMVGVKTREDFPGQPLPLIFFNLQDGNSFFLKLVTEMNLKIGERRALGLVINSLRKKFNLETVRVEVPELGTVYKLTPKNK